MTVAYALPTWAVLPALADAALDRVARSVAEELAAPRALVVLVSKAGQVFPGAFGLPEPWASRRSMPLSHSMSRWVATSGSHLALRDAREHPEFATGPSVRELSAVAYAGMPLWDVHDQPIGVLCVIDTRPRDWTEQELDTLRRMADETSRQLRFRAIELAEQEARAVALRDDSAAQSAAEAARAAFVLAEADADRARVVARLSTALLSAETLPDLLHTVDRLVRSPLGATTVLLGVAEVGGPELRVWSATAGVPSGPDPVACLRVDDAHPLAAAMRERHLVAVASPEESSAFPGLTELPGAGPVLAIHLALGQHHSDAALLVGWTQPRQLDAPVRAVVTDLARPVGHALDRVLLREQRLRLTELPPGPAQA
ncbi:MULTISPECIES: GAF domain-containing protein [unclassified Modestobacter]|uniref:GAF domain-containing protein n=1 Tax=unclassified Modestobacter TaxID=2643866 RepID=UPI0022AB0F63|nr:MULTISPECIES: GAF domain-containing protein [unclassified Modestobacter]MCZ2810866.1 GAF domain-containing protein [Modestobacter sp. VKM Ac-2979]MCZ2840379.1 GAF domain-containing protein [Modestobacter sp. VKM Ac-2980]MCZ2849507.1 GAF domain-containing protein [Modestobacter sp. VKM Ac-2978]